MGTETNNYIMGYDTPLGEFRVDESYDIWLNGERIDSTESSIVGVRKKIAELIDRKRGEEVHVLQKRISELNGMSHMIENYRVKFI